MEDVANCKITGQGLRKICNGNITRLKYLHLGNIALMQLTIILATME
jgi:hypothetical protein